MAIETGMDGYMYFVGEGKHGPDKKSIGRVRGETIDTRFSTHGAFKIWSFSWRSAHESSSFSDDDLPPPGDSEEETTESGTPVTSRRAKMRRMSSNRLDARVSVGAFEISKDVDVATPTLFLAHATCSVFEGCHIYFRKTGGGKLFTFFHMTFSEVIIEGWECGLDSDTKERLVVNFNWCQLNYFPQSVGGVRKRDAANMKQFCTSDPDSQAVPKILRATAVADMDIMAKD